MARLELTTSWSQTRHTTNCTTPRYFCNNLLSAERGGFEPPVQNDPYDGLANRWFQPLTHLSKACCRINYYSKFSIFLCQKSCFNTTIRLCKCACKYRTTFFFSKKNSDKKLGILVVLSGQKTHNKMQITQSHIFFVRYLCNKVFYLKNVWLKNSVNQHDIGNMLLKPLILLENRNAPFIFESENRSETY